MDWKKRFNIINDRFEKERGYKISSATWQAQIKDMMLEGKSNEEIYKSCIKKDDLFKSKSFRIQFVNFLSGLTEIINSYEIERKS